MPISACHLVQGSFGCGDRSGGGCGVVGATLSVGQGTGRAGKCLLAREHNVVEAEHALGRACMEWDAIHDRAGAIQ
jgi:hypothetical protein